MREIKFEYGFENIRYGGIHKEVYSLIDIENGCPIDFVDENAEYRLKYRRQYTGIKGKNVVEIYEGDIVKGKKYGQDVIGTIQHESIHWFVNENKRLHYLGGISNIEVIGNIYENPGILKGEKQDDKTM